MDFLSGGFSVGVLSNEFVRDVYNAFVQGSHVHEIFTMEFCLVRPYTICVHQCIYVYKPVVCLHACLRACVRACVFACVHACFRIIET